MLLQLSKEEINKLYRLSQDKTLVEALKKLFLNQLVKIDGNSVAIHALDDCFRDLANIHPEDKEITKLENMV